MKEETKYPVNECKVTVSIEVQHEGAGNFRVKYDWFQNQADKDSLAPVEVDAGALREWHTLKVEGEPEDVVREEVEKPGAKKAPGGKAAP